MNCPSPTTGIYLSAGKPVKKGVIFWLGFVGVTTQHNLVPPAVLHVLKHVKEHEHHCRENMKIAIGYGRDIGTAERCEGLFAGSLRL